MLKEEEPPNMLTYKEIQQGFDGKEIISTKTLIKNLQKNDKSFTKNHIKASIGKCEYTLEYSGQIFLFSENRNSREDEFFKFLSKIMDFKATQKNHKVSVKEIQHIQKKYLNLDNQEFISRLEKQGFLIKKKFITRDENFKQTISEDQTESLNQSYQIPDHSSSSESRDLNIDLIEIFHSETKQDEIRKMGRVIVTTKELDGLDEYGYLGRTIMPSVECHESYYININEPFSFVNVGLQGSGKSHTMSCILEACLLDIPPANQSYFKRQVPMSCLVFHYDDSEFSHCELMGLLHPNKNNKNSLKFHVDPKNVTVLVSPCNYKNRKEEYQGHYCEVRSLQFQWEELSANHLKILMSLSDGEPPLYFQSMMNLLQEYQKKDEKPESFQAFEKEIFKVCSANGQTKPLIQRLNILKSFIVEKGSSGKENKSNFKYGNVKQDCQAGKLVIVDLTDPFITKESANNIFQVLTAQFRGLRLNCGKILALDEAHKYINGESNSIDGLSKSIVDLVRMMRHEGIRLLISSQSPLTICPEIFELISVSILHRFHSRRWFDYLKNKIPLGEPDFDRIKSLETGSALIYASKNREQKDLTKIYIRNKLTSDSGSTNTNQVLEK